MHAITDFDVYAQERRDWLALQQENEWLRQEVENAAPAVGMAIVGIVALGVGFVLGVVLG